MRQNYTTFPEVVKQVGKSYDTVRYAVLVKRVVEPRTIAKTRLFTPEQVETLKTHFSK